YVDINAFFRSLLKGHAQVSAAAACVTVLVVAPFLFRFWRRLNSSDLSLVWSGTIIWTAILNPYTPIYDTPMVVIAAVLLFDWLRMRVREERLWLAKGLLYAVYVTPLLELLGRPVERHLNLYTVALAGLGIYQLYLQRVSEDLAVRAHS